MRKKSRATFWPNIDLYLLMLPALVVLLAFRYLPMAGIQIAFKDFNLMDGIWGSAWVGFQYFEEVFTSQKFYDVFANTLIINFLRLVIQFPIPIILAVMIYEIQGKFFKRFAQTTTYLPHFLSWVVVGAMFFTILSPETGVVNTIIVALGGKPIFFLADDGWFRFVLIFTDAWKISGWSSVIYLAAMQSIDPQLYEAAHMDGASKMQRIWHVTLPGISSTIVFIIMLRLGSALNDNIEQILMLYNPMVYGSGDVLGTYVYRIGLGQMRYSMTAAVGLFSSVIGFLLIVIANAVSKRFGERSLF